MDILKKLAHLFGGSKYEKPIYLYTVKCKRCGELLHGRVDLHNDVSLDDDGKGYHCHKVLTGEGANHCFNQVSVDLFFNLERRFITHEISGGTFLEE